MTLKLVRLGQIAATEDAPSQPESVPVDLAKAAKVLGIAPKYHPKLNKVLAGRPSAYEKGLTVLAAELELAIAGRELEGVEESPPLGASEPAHRLPAPAAEEVRIVRRQPDTHQSR